MAGRVFISQAALAAWVTSERVELQGDTLTFRVSNASLSLVPASFFQSVSGGEDLHGLVGKVKDEAWTAALGAEAYMTSVLIGETAYEVDPGFLATPLSDAPEAHEALLSAVRAAAAA